MVVILLWASPTPPEGHSNIYSFSPSLNKVQPCFLSEDTEEDVTEIGRAWEPIPDVVPVFGEMDDVETEAVWGPALPHRTPPFARLRSASAPIDDAAVAADDEDDYDGGSNTSNAFVAADMLLPRLR